MNENKDDKFDSKSLVIGACVSSIVTLFGNYAYVISGGTHTGACLVIDTVVLGASSAIGFGVELSRRSSKKTTNSKPRNPVP